MSLDIIARGMAASADSKAADAQNKADLAINMVSDFPTGLTYKGSCTYSELPGNASVGDAWTVTDRDNMEYAWDGNDWIQIGIGTVDQTYDPTSTNAQSGTAVSQAVNPILQYITYSISNNTVTITGCDTSISGSYEIPMMIEGYSVTSIGDEAFRFCYGLTSVIIGNSVTSIGNSAFYQCYGLTSITIGDSVTEISAFAFAHCTSFTSITIPDSVTSIGSEAFRGCTGLTSFTIPDSVTKIGSWAFYGCTGLTSVTIGDSVTKIGDYAFIGCTGLTEIVIPDSVTLIGNYAFNGCNSIQTIYYGGSEEQWNALSNRPTVVSGGYIYYNQKAAIKQDIYDYHDDTKQDKLIAGNNITIKNRVISAVVERGVGEKTQEKGEIFNVYPDGYFNPEITNSDLVTFNGSDQYARFQYTKGVANYSAGSSYRFEMDCLIYSGTPMIRVGADETGARIPEQSDYISYYDKTNGKYIVQFTFNSNWNGQNLGIMVGNYETSCQFVCANPALYLLDSEGNPVGSNLINTFADDYYSTSRAGNKWNRRSSGYTCTPLSDSLIAEISNNNLKAGYLSHAEGQGTWATARMAHAEGRGNNFECTLVGYADNILTLTSKNGSDVASIRKNAVLFIEQDGFGKFVYATSSATDDGAGAYNVTINENLDSISIFANVKVIMGGSTSSWAHTEGNFTNAVDLNAEDLEDTVDSKTRQHAEGSRTLAAGYAAHAEGEYSQALGNQSHAEGEKTVAGGVGSHAEGRRTQALAEGSHTSGLDTIVNAGDVNRGATAIGRFNEPKDGDLFEVGNGTSDSDRHNAFEVKSDGSAVFNGNIQVNGELTGTPIIIKGGDGGSAPANKIAISNASAGQITNEDTATLFGFTSPSASDLTVGHSRYNLRLRGKEAHPQYNGKNIALSEDITPAPVQSISAGGTALTPDSSGNVEIPKATGGGSGAQPGTFGVVNSINQYQYGIQVNNGLISLYGATESQIDNRVSQTYNNAAVRLQNVDYVVERVMGDGTGPTWTPSEQKAATTRIGAQPKWRVIKDATLSSGEESNIIEINVDSDNENFALSAIRVQLFNPPDNSLSATTSSGTLNLRGTNYDPETQGSGYCQYGFYTLKRKSNNTFAYFEANTSSTGFYVGVRGGNTSETSAPQNMSINYGINTSNTLSTTAITGVQFKLNSSEDTFIAGTRVLVEGIDA